LALIYAINSQEFLKIPLGQTVGNEKSMSTNNLSHGIVFHTIIRVSFSLKMTKVYGDMLDRIEKNTFKRQVEE